MGAKEGESLTILENVLELYANEDLKEKLEGKSNPLKLAIMNSNTEGAKLLIDKEYSCIFDRKFGLNALHSCIKYMNPELIQYMLGKHPNLRKELDANKKSPLHYVVDLKWPEVIQKRSESVDGRKDILKKLLEKDLTDVDQLNNQ